MLNNIPRLLSVLLTMLLLTLQRVLEIALSKMLTSGKEFSQRPTPPTMDQK